jgi:UDP-N-acetylglucosamine--N-acetylmuramyl-(pentapeptide) pyrophosphoryl-undecaprenol N-acetylglucosamine transferase
MKILAVGGGSGGHVTPVVAVYKELQKRTEVLDFHFICDKNFYSQTTKLFADTNAKIHVVAAGKLRRYANLKWFMHLHPYHIVHTHIANVIDLFKICCGYFQSARLIKKIRPDVLFVKGGFVSLPVGLAAKKRGVPIVIHDSDVVSGLTNRILAKAASKIGTGSPVENYPNYPKDKTRFVGIPIDSKFFDDMTPSEKHSVFAQYGFDKKYPLVLMTGGGGGSEFLNDLASLSASILTGKQVQILLLTGEKTKARFIDSEYFKAVSFVSGLADVIRAADLVVSRAGASSFAELAAAAKPTILVPHPHLAGNHQVKNAEVYGRAGAAVVMQEDDLTPEIFTNTVWDLLQNKTKLNDLARSIHKLARPNALHDIVDLILETRSSNNVKR